MRKILILTDFSENATNALKYAIDLFKYDKSEFFIMHAYQDDIYSNKYKVSRTTLVKVTKKVANSSQKQLEVLLQNIKQISPNPKHAYNIISANNILVDEAEIIADKESIDLIVMATRGFTNNKKITFGSYTLQVLKYVQCPVLVIPEGYKFNKPKQILFPTNYLIPYKRRELKLLSELASQNSSKIDMLYIATIKKISMRQQDNSDFIKEQFFKNELRFVTLNSNEITNTITSYIKENSIDMLVMVNNRHTYLEDMLTQTTIDKMSFSVHIPFLVLQNVKRDIIHF